MYLDPGAWSVIAQVLVGVLVAVPVLVGVYWRRIKLYFSTLRKGKIYEEEDK